jgi:hypothetical protein
MYHEKNNIDVAFAELLYLPLQVMHHFYFLKSDKKITREERKAC